MEADVSSIGTWVRTWAYAVREDPTGSTTLRHHPWAMAHPQAMETNAYHHIQRVPTWHFTFSYSFPIPPTLMTQQVQVACFFGPL